MSLQEVRNKLQSHLKTVIARAIKQSLHLKLQ